MSCEPGPLERDHGPIPVMRAASAISDAESDDVFFVDLGVDDDGQGGAVGGPRMADKFVHFDGAKPGGAQAMGASQRRRNSVEKGSSRKLGRSISEILSSAGNSVEDPSSPSRGLGAGPLLKRPPSPRTIKKIADLSRQM